MSTAKRNRMGFISPMGSCVTVCCASDHLKLSNVVRFVRTKQSTRILCLQMSRSRDSVRTDFQCLCENRSIDAVTIISSQPSCIMAVIRHRRRSFGCHESCFRCSLGSPNCFSMRATSHTSQIEPHRATRILRRTYTEKYRKRFASQL